MYPYPRAGGHLEPGAPGSAGALLGLRGAWAAVHVTCHGDGRGLRLRDEDGRVVAVGAEAIVAALRGRARLVVLGACWSGAPGGRRAGAVEWLGLTTAFLNAGARAVVERARERLAGLDWAAVANLPDSAHPATPAHPEVSGQPASAAGG